MRYIYSFALALVCLSGCAHLKAAGSAAKACELAQLPAEEQSVASSVTAIALNPGSTVADLESLALSVGGNQFKCIVQAVQAFIASMAPAAPASNAPAAQAVMSASVDYTRDHARQVLSQYLAAHP